jgi:hypothetical protein
MAVAGDFAAIIDAECVGQQDVQIRGDQRVQVGQLALVIAVGVEVAGRSGGKVADQVADGVQGEGAGLEFRIGIAGGSLIHERRIL